MYRSNLNNAHITSSQSSLKHRLYPGVNLRLKASFFVYLWALDSRDKAFWKVSMRNMKIWPMETNYENLLILEAGL